MGLKGEEIRHNVCPPGVEDSSAGAGYRASGPASLGGNCLCQDAVSNSRPFLRFGGDVRSWGGAINYKYRGVGATRAAFTRRIKG